MTQFFFFSHTPSIQTSRSFEEVALRFVHREARDALRVFLLTRLQRTDPKKDISQRVMLCTWLTELFLNQLNQVRVLVFSRYFLWFLY